MERKYYSRLKHQGGIEVVEFTTDEEGVTSMFAVSVETMSPPVTLYKDTGDSSSEEVSRVLVNRTHFMKRVNPKHILAEHVELQEAPIEHVQILRRVRDGEFA